MCTAVMSMRGHSLPLNTLLLIHVFRLFIGKVTGMKGLRVKERQIVSKVSNVICQYDFQHIYQR